MILWEYIWAYQSLNFSLHLENRWICSHNSLPYRMQRKACLDSSSISFSTKQQQNLLAPLISSFTILWVFKFPFNVSTKRPKIWDWWQPNQWQQDGCTILLGHRAAACPRQNLGVWPQPKADARQSVEWHSCFQFLPFSWKMGIYLAMPDLILCQIPVSTSTWIVLELRHFLHCFNQVVLILLKC